MMFLLKQIFGFIKLLNSETGNNQLAWGVAMGFILGMTPALSLQSLLVFLLLFFFRIQIGAAFLTAFFFKFVAYAMDPAFDVIGQKVLEMPALQAIFTTLYNMPLVPYTRFNNSIVMGSAVLTIILSPFIFVLAKVMILKYRKNVVEKLGQTKFFKALKATSLYQWYYKYDQYFG